ncbi:MAG: mechanosensitive ion channel [Candidatus Cloacimonetes bacterium]|nr:mechanosensitive ion channel [Candidatus Cloacimonadota bacterium]
MFKRVSLVLICLLAGAYFYLYGQVPLSFSALPDSITKVGVFFARDHVIDIYAGYGEIGREERAELISKRISDLNRNKVYPDSIFIKYQDSEYQILHGTKRLLSISKADSLALASPLVEIAQAYQSELKQYYLEEHLNRSFWQNVTYYAIMVLYLAIIILITLFLIRMLGKLMRYLIGLVRLNRIRHPDGFYFKGIRFITAQQFDSVSTLFIRLVKIFLVLWIVYLAFYMVLYVIPGTRGFARQLQSYIMLPIKSVGNALINFVPNAFFILVIILITRYVLKLLVYIFGEIEKGHLKFTGFYPEWAMPTYQLLKALIYIFTIIIIFPYLPGSGSPAFQGVSIFVGVLFSLGSSSAIANMVAGIILTYMRPYQIGDMIKIGDKFGELKEVTLLVIRIKTPKNEEITIPNSLVLSGHINNYSRYAREERLILYTSVTIGYDVPWRKVHQLLIDASRRTEGINQDLEPFVLQKKLDDFSVEYELNVYTSFPEIMPPLLSNLHKNIQDTFREAGVEIMSPRYNAVRDGNQVTIPKE